MATNENQNLTVDNNMIDLTKDSSASNMDQQITINEPNEKPEQKLEDNIINTLNKEKIELDQTKSDSTENSSDQNAKNENLPKSYIDKLLCIFSFIRPYFKVTFNDVKSRIIKSFLPINNSFFDIAIEHPDLYGPFWIYTTLIYVIAAGGALSYYFTNSVNNYFQAFVPVAGSILYCFGFNLTSTI